MTQGYAETDFGTQNVNSIDSWGQVLTNLIALTEPISMDDMPPLEEEPENSA